MSNVRVCPVCKRRVEKTMHDNIAGHMNSTRTQPCEGSFKPWHIAYIITQEKPA